MNYFFSFLVILMIAGGSAQEKPTLYLIGDSTMSDKKDPEENPEHGWGQILPKLMTSNINIENHAVNGRSTRSFIAEGRWDDVLDKLQPGDFLFIQFGHNDQKVNDPERYTNPFTQYRYNLERFVNEAREKGAKPYLFSPIVRRNFNEQGVLVDTHGEYPLVVRMVADHLNVPFIDHQWLTEKMEIAYGPEMSKSLHLHLEPGEDPYKPGGLEDNTHLSEKGALLVASLALNQILQQKMELARYVKKEVLQLPAAPPVDDMTGSQVSWRRILSQDQAWYGSEEAQRIAGNVLLYQKNNGGWEKNLNMALKLDSVQKQKLLAEKTNIRGTTIDNNGTVLPMRFLAMVFKATEKEPYKQAFLHGVDFLLEAQYDNGGWPQYYPIRKGYYEHITYNDGAMIGVMEILRDMAEGKEPYDFVESSLRRKAKKAIKKGLQTILKTQVKVAGKLTVWGSQHDKKTLQPAKARAYELPSLSGKESVEIVEYLMGIENPNEEVKKAIRSAIAWFEETKITGKKVVWKKDETLPEGVDRLVIDEKNANPLWARFYEIGTNQPMFVGRDGVVKDKLSEIEHERRINYSYIDDYAKDLLNEDYPEWERRH